MGRPAYSKEEIIKKAKLVHGDRYDYSKMNYITDQKPVEIVCRIHGSFWQRIDVHLLCYGCKQCCKEELFKKNKQRFIDISNNLYDNKFDYSKVNYLGVKELVEIICPEHGSFYRTPDFHMCGGGCPKELKVRLLNKESFVKIANEMHNYKYDYSKFEFTNMKTQGIIICPFHGEFLQAPAKHLLDRGCVICGRDKRNKKLINPFEPILEKCKQLYNNKYDYSKFIYKDGKTKGIIICPEHGEFLQAISYHSGGEECPKCGIKKSADKKRSNVEEFTQKANIIFNNRYDYSEFIYVNSMTKGIIKCPIHGIFCQRPNDHLRGQECPCCASFQNELIVKSICEQIFKYKFTKVRPHWLLGTKNRPLELDGYCAELNFAFEYNGIQHYEMVKHFNMDESKLIDRKQKDAKKLQLCIDNNVKLMVIPYFRPKFTKYHLKQFIYDFCIKNNIVLPDNFADIELNYEL